MTRRELIDYCLTYPDAYEDYPFDALSDAPAAWAVLRHKGSKKSFAFIYQRGGLCVNLKCEPLFADFLRHVYPGVTRKNATRQSVIRLKSLSCTKERGREERFL